MTPPSVGHAHTHTHTHVHVQENLPVYLDQYVSYIAGQNNHQRVASLLQILRSLIAQGHLKPGYVSTLLIYIIIYRTVDQEIFVIKKFSSMIFSNEN
jgi:hypothetical protein